MSDERPMRDVVDAKWRSGAGGLLSPQRFTIRWWDLTLSCGHVVERTARSKPGVRKPGFAGMYHPPADDEYLPPQKRARCDECASKQPTGGA